MLQLLKITFHNRHSTLIFQDSIMSNVQTIVDKEERSTYRGEVITKMVKTKIVTLIHGQGRRLQYPYLFVGQFEEGNFKSGAIYVQHNCAPGEIFDFEKHNRGEIRVDELLASAASPENFDYTFLTTV